MATYLDTAPGITVVPGQWRPHFPWEHIAWVSTPWRSHDYVWLDIPEAIYAGTELLFLSHTNPRHPSLNPSLPADPFFPDLAPGERHEIHGRIAFLDGGIEGFDFAVMQP